MNSNAKSSTYLIIEKSGIKRLTTLGEPFFIRTYYPVGQF
jgi:hypothetical protein